MNYKSAGLLLIIIGVLIAALTHYGKAYGLDTFQITEQRYCGKPGRWANGKIKRSRTLVKRFIAMYPLPDGLDRSEWSVDHVIPLVSGGCDAIINLQWLPNSIKRTGDDDNKDRWEQTIYPRNY